MIFFNYFRQIDNYPQVMNNHYFCKYRLIAILFNDFKNKAKKSASNLKGALLNCTRCN
ncbi:hypothetical protein D1BOALGB6SA_6536 [Olavius sp. associated proteobacterium Delta 1]|nr:hypothetical protein D1BOALGB6SA_6536 [Olavius sp. associated proteobacterium Delta 1]